VSAGWVAASVRARAMGRRRVGVAAARALAASASYRDAIESLARSSYAEYVQSGDDLAAAAHGIGAAVLWNLRVLAGWVPPAGAEILRTLAGWFEIANIEQHIGQMAGRPAQPPYHLGSLAVAWPRLAGIGSLEHLSAGLGSSAWGAPSGPTPFDIELSLRLSWGQRVAARVPGARPWAAAAVALLLARERFIRRTDLSASIVEAAGRVVGRRAASAETLADLRQTMPRDASWVLDGISDASELWRAEALWWGRLRDDSARLVAGSGFGPEPSVGAAGLLAADARLVVGALALAGRGSTAVEVFDELA
jgi:hypothetical protein